MARKTNKPKLAVELRQLRAECTPHMARASALLNTFPWWQTREEQPPVEVVYETYVSDWLAEFIVRPSNRCAHAHGGEERTADEPEVINPPPEVLLTPVS